MDDLYKELQAVTANVLGEFKQGTVEYVALTPGGGTPDNPGEPQEVPTPINATVRGVSFKYVDNSNVVGSDLQLTMPGDGVVPTMAGFVRVDGVRYKIVAVHRKPAAGTPVAFVIIFRK